MAQSDVYFYVLVSRAEKEQQLYNIYLIGIIQLIADKMGSKIKS